MQDEKKKKKIEDTFEMNPAKHKEKSWIHKILRKICLIIRKKGSIIVKEVFEKKEKEKKENVLCFSFDMGKAIIDAKGKGKGKGKTLELNGMADVSSIYY